MALQEARSAAAGAEAGGETGQVAAPATSGKGAAR